MWVSMLCRTSCLLYNLFRSHCLYYRVSFCSRFCCQALTRPLSVPCPIVYFHRHFGYQLYQSDPAGNYSGWKATAIGSNSQSAQSKLKSEFK